MTPRAAVLSGIGVSTLGLVAAWMIFRSAGGYGRAEVRSPHGTRGLQRVLQELPPRPGTSVLEVPFDLTPVVAKSPSTSAVPDPCELPERTLAELKAKREAIENILAEESAPIAVQRIKDGGGEPVPDQENPLAPAPGQDPSLICCVVEQSTGEWDRTILPREQYPDLYVLYDETLRLHQLIERRTVWRYTDGVAMEVDRGW